MSCIIAHTMQTHSTIRDGVGFPGCLLNMGCDTDLVLITLKNDVMHDLIVLAYISNTTIRRDVRLRK